MNPSLRLWILKVKIIQNFVFICDSYLLHQLVSKPSWWAPTVMYHWFFPKHVPKFWKKIMKIGLFVETMSHDQRVVCDWSTLTGLFHQYHCWLLSDQKNVHMLASDNHFLLPVVPKIHHNPKILEILKTYSSSWIIFSF